MENIRLHNMYHNSTFWEVGMKRLCGLMLFCIGVGMTCVLILQKSFLLVMITILFLIIGYNLFCGK